jgi:SpoIID/LytB domain protein
MISGRRLPRRLRTALALLAVVLSVASMSDLAPTAVDATGSGRMVTITGRGWGHGRGLGQYGAYGYATDHGWTSAQILDHYYGGTTAGPAPMNGPVWPLAVRVELRSFRGRDTVVALTDGTIVVRGLDEAELARTTAGAVRARWVADRYEIDTAPSCNGPWTRHTTVTGRTTVRFQAQTSAPGPDGLLQACGASHTTWYHGELRAVAHGGSERTVNVLPVDQYLRGVVPREMPASWPDAALQAQAVAARSYALAGDTRQLPYADTCDTTLCQVYDGAYTTRGGAGFRSATDIRTDAAILATAGLVRLSGGMPARTEFSSSTGGHTAGGTFPAVADAGDAIDRNPHRTWTVTVDVSSLESRYGRGRLLAINVTRRNGLGADGGRVTAVELRFEQGSVTESGSTVRSLLGLKSDWFTPGVVMEPGQRESPAGAYIDRTYQRLVGRTATDVELVRWWTAVAKGNRLDLTGLLVRSDYFLGRIADDLYQRALSRSADAEGRAYWVGQMMRGLKVEHTGVLLFGSPEYYLRSGGTSTSFVTTLYRGILGREPDPGGLAYWTGLLDNGRAATDDVAAGFYRSLESRRERVASLHVQIRGVELSPAGVDLLAHRLLAVDDLVVAAEIAASPEA